MTATELIRTHQTGVWRYLRYLGCDAATADDLTQETFVAVMRKMPENHGEAAVASYLRTAARHQYLMAMRKQGQAPPHVDLELAEQVWTDTLQGDDGSAAIDALSDCLPELTDRAQQAISQHYSKRKSRDEIATALDMTPDGVKTLLRRARAKLRECIERKLKQ